jgi:hypothetical protein
VRLGELHNGDAARAQHLELLCGGHQYKIVHGLAEGMIGDESSWGLDGRA